MAKRISEEAAQVVGFAEAVKKTATDISKDVVDFDPDKVLKMDWDAVINNIDQITDLAKRSKTAAIEARSQCQPELGLTSGKVVGMPKTNRSVAAATG